MHSVVAGSCAAALEVAGQDALRRIRASDQHRLRVDGAALLLASIGVGARSWRPIVPDRRVRPTTGPGPAQPWSASQLATATTNPRRWWSARAPGRKGSVWVLSFLDGASVPELVAADYYRDAAF